MDLTTVEGQLRDYLRKSGRGLAHTADLPARELVWVLGTNPHMTSFGEALRAQLDRELKADAIITAVSLAAPDESYEERRVRVIGQARKLKDDQVREAHQAYEAARLGAETQFTELVEEVERERPAPGDSVELADGRTGRVI